MRVVPNKCVIFSGLEIYTVGVPTDYFSIYRLDYLCTFSRSYVRVYITVRTMSTVLTYITLTHAHSVSALKRKRVRRMRDFILKNLSRL